MRVPAANSGGFGHKNWQGLTCSIGTMMINHVDDLMNHPMSRCSSLLFYDNQGIYQRVKWPALLHRNKIAVKMLRLSEWKKYHM